MSKNNKNLINKKKQSELKKIGAKEFKITDEMKARSPLAFGPPKGKFVVTCRSCKGKGWVMMFGGPPQQPCRTCEGSGVQVVKTLEPREWMNERKYKTDILGVCKNCGFYLGNGKPCKVMKKELDKKRMVLRTKSRYGETTHTPNYEMVAKPDSTCNVWKSKPRKQRR